MAEVKTLERCGAIVSRSLEVTAGHGHTHTSELVRWDQVYSGSADVDVQLHHALTDLLVAGVRAAVVAPERELKGWFSWQWYWDDAILSDARLIHIDGYVATT